MCTMPGSGTSAAGEGASEDIGHAFDHPRACRAMSVTKSDIMKLSFSSVNSKIFYAFGVDSQVVQAARHAFYLTDLQLIAGQWEEAGGSSNVAIRFLPILFDRLRPQAKAVQEDVPVTVSTGGHKGTHVVTGGSLRKVGDLMGCMEGMTSRPGF